MLPDRPDFSRRASIIERWTSLLARSVARLFARHRPHQSLDTCLSAAPGLAQRVRPHRSQASAARVRILDVGSGYGDGLRRVEQWARQNLIDAELCGLDLSPDATAIAIEATSNGSGIKWVTADVLTYAPAEPPHLVMSSLFTHHLSDAEIVQFLRWMEQKAELGWFINDLSRAAVPYHFFRIASKLVGLHPFVQFDGPASILKAFVPRDWQGFCTAAGLSESDYTLRAYKPARLCVERMQPTRYRARSRDKGERNHDSRSAQHRSPDHRRRARWLPARNSACVCGQESYASRKRTRPASQSLRRVSEP